MMQVIAAKDVRVGDILAEGLVMSVKREGRTVVLEMPLGRTFAPSFAKVARICRLEDAPTRELIKRLRNRAQVSGPLTPGA